MHTYKHRASPPSRWKTDTHRAHDRKLREKEGQGLARVHQGKAPGLVRRHKVIVRAGVGEGKVDFPPTVEQRRGDGARGEAGCRGRRGAGRGRVAALVVVEPPGYPPVPVV